MQIGTSVGIIVPKAVVKDLEMRVGHKLDLMINSRSEMILRKKKNAREGWAKAFFNYVNDTDCLDYVELDSNKQLQEVE